jgi:hypothetical protein
MRHLTRIDRAGGALWASAFVIAALIIVQAGRLQTNAAHAEMTSQMGGYTLMTTDSGLGGDMDPNQLLYVIDSRAQAVMVYEIEDARKKQIILRDGRSLDALFRVARP